MDGIDYSALYNDQLDAQYQFLMSVIAQVDRKQPSNAVRGSRIRKPTTTKPTRAKKTRGPTEAQKTQSVAYSEAEKGFLMNLETRHSTETGSVQNFDSLFAEYQETYGHLGRTRKAVTQVIYRLRRAQGLPAKHTRINIGGKGAALKREARKAQEVQELREGLEGQEVQTKADSDIHEWGFGVSAEYQW